MTTEMTIDEATAILTAAFVEGREVPMDAITEAFGTIGGGVAHYQLGRVVYTAMLRQSLARLRARHATLTAQVESLPKPPVH